MSNQNQLKQKIHSELCALLRQARQEANLTVEEAASIMGCNLKTLQRWEDAGCQAALRKSVFDLLQVLLVYNKIPVIGLGEIPQEITIAPEFLLPSWSDAKLQSILDARAKMRQERQ